MKTIDPLHLEALYETGKPIELIDVRPQEEFDRLHALGARSVPLPEFIPAEVLRTRHLPYREPLYFICRKEMLARCAAEQLHRAGFDNAIIAEGGIEAWEHRGLPVVRQRLAAAILRRIRIAALTVVLIVAFFTLELLVTLVALGILALDFLKSRCCRRNSHRNPCSEFAGESAVNGLDVIPPWLTR
jgi:rhodanese-related sulfurtransferase